MQQSSGLPHKTIWSYGVSHWIFRKPFLWATFSLMIVCVYLLSWTTEKL